MRIATLILSSAAALALAGCGQKAPTADSSDAAASASVAANEAPAPALGDGQAFANTAAASDAFEIAASKLAATQAASSAVKSFAQHMITAHTASTAKLKEAAAAAAPAVEPDPALTAAQQAKLDSLKPLHGADFDKAFGAAQVEAHEQTLQALKDYAASGTVAPFKAFATASIPTVTAHLNLAKGLK